jgi:hypothetical protein
MSAHQLSGTRDSTIAIAKNISEADALVERPGLMLPPAAE